VAWLGIKDFLPTCLIFVPLERRVTFSVLQPVLGSPIQICRRSQLKLLDGWKTCRAASKGLLVESSCRHAIYSTSAAEERVQLNYRK